MQHNHVQRVPKCRLPLSFAQVQSVLAWGCDRPPSLLIHGDRGYGWINACSIKVQRPGRTRPIARDH